MVFGSKRHLVRPLVGIVLATQALTAAVPQRSQPSTAATRFEVASIRRNPGKGLGRISTEPGGRFVVTNMTLDTVITSAFGIRGFQLVDAPRWVYVEKYDILARTGLDDYPSVVAMRPVIQALLAERFQLEVSREPREMQTYALVRLRPDALGPQLVQSKADCRSPESRDLANPVRCGTDSPGDGVITGKGSASVSLANILGAFAGTFVDDETGLTGAFDFTLKWNPNLNDDPADGVSMFTAVQEQLGLKLDPRRRAVDVIAIKRIERPTEN